MNPRRKSSGASLLVISSCKTISPPELNLSESVGRMTGRVCVSDFAMVRDSDRWISGADVRVSVLEGCVGGCVGEYGGSVFE